MNAGIKKTLIGLAAGAFGIAMVGCGGSSSEPEAAPAAEGTSGGEAAQAAPADEAAKPADGTAADAGAGGEHSCGQGSCGGKQ